VACIRELQIMEVTVSASTHMLARKMQAIKAIEGAFAISHSGDLTLDVLQWLATLHATRTF